MNSNTWTKCACCSTNSLIHTDTPCPTNRRIILECSANVSVQGAFREGYFSPLLLHLNRTDERFNTPQSVSYFNMSELAVISPLIASQNPPFTTRIQSPSDYNEKIMIDRIKDRIGIDWSATRPQASKDWGVARRTETEAWAVYVLEIRGK